MYEVYIEIEPEVCPYCGKHERVCFINAWVEEEGIFTESYYCANCSKEYHVDYDITNPRYRKV